MLAPELLVAGVMALALIIYTLGAGADFGAGVWDLLARGPTRHAQRAVIGKALGPIWEANHVWLILIVVLLFVCFPAAHAAIATALHVPLTLVLIGVVLRGSAYVFQHYDTDEHGEWVMTLDTYATNTPGEDPARKTVPVDLRGCTGYKVGVVCAQAATRNIVVRARMSCERPA